MFHTQTEFDSYLAETAGIEAPAINEQVLFGFPGETSTDCYRVRGWYRATPDIKPEAGPDFDEELWEEFAEDRARRALKRRVRVIPCKRDEATHVGLVGIGGTIARINLVERLRISSSPEETAKAAGDWATFFIPNGAAVEARAY